jgi:hypothetical protein
MKMAVISVTVSLFSPELGNKGPHLRVAGSYAHTLEHACTGGRPAAAAAAFRPAPAVITPAH